jgi:lysophospholipase L1-like esterase
VSTTYLGYTPTSTNTALDGNAFHATTASLDALWLPALPEYVFATEGVETNCYFSALAIAETGVPFSPIVTCTKGYTLSECFRYIPVAADDTKVGQTYAWSVALWCGGGWLLNPSLSTVLEASAVSTSLWVTKKTRAAKSLNIITLGDSLTAAASYQAQMNTREAADGNTTITFCGTEGSGATLNEGRSGWSVADYNGETSRGRDPLQNAFWDTGTASFNFGNYRSVHSIAAPDLVTILLGWNDLFGLPITDDDATVQSFANAQFAKIDGWISSIIADTATAQVAILTLPPPVYSQDGFGVVYANNTARLPKVRMRANWNKALVAYFGGRTGSNVWVIPTGTALDQQYGFQRTATAVFQDTSETILRAQNSVHPEAAGYYQIGDQIWAAVKAIFS